MSKYEEDLLLSPQWKPRLWQTQSSTENTQEHWGGCTGPVTAQPAGPTARIPEFPRVVHSMYWPTSKGTQGTQLVPRVCHQHVAGSPPSPHSTDPTHFPPKSPSNGTSIPPQDHAQRVLAARKRPSHAHLVSYEPKPPGTQRYKGTCL